MLILHLFFHCYSEKCLEEEKTRIVRDENRSVLNILPPFDAGIEFAIEMIAKKKNKIENRLIFVEEVIEQMEMVSTKYNLSNVCKTR